ncbi:hypothetical protein ACFFU9_07980 [Mariniflexile ostreae]|uniref:Uncharacterized protein n=1 Tax=Mariniflexile ostreae TaxID=1520892 RepID=A0ABV5FB67_9FLAO
MAKSELHFLGHIIQLITVETNYNKDFNNYKGTPILYNQGGLLRFVFAFGENFPFLERMTTVDYKRYKLSYPVDDGKVVFYDANHDVLKIWKFKDAPIVYYKVEFDPNGAGMQVEMIISPAIQDYGCKIHRSWHITPIEEETYQSPVYAIEEKEKKPFRIDIGANNSDIKNGVFGFDKIPSNYKSICTSNIEKLRQEYQPIADILDKEYLPSWLSIRKGQTVELELNWEKKGRADDYTNITFDRHPDFIITPTNLKGTDKVQITCKNNNPSTAQLLIKANSKTVGALNIFYPKPKTIDLEWCFVEITGDKKDEFDLGKKIKKSNLENLLEKGLKPALIDVAVSNTTAKIIDITEYTDRQKQLGVLKKHLNDRIGDYIERSLVNRVFATIGMKHNKDINKLTLYVINRKCIVTADIPDSGSFPMAGGLSPTGTGVSYMVLGDGNNIDLRNVMHEIMHSLGLHHTFIKDGESTTKFTHKFKKEKTKNYMDYRDNKEITWKWQWRKLHQYSKLN